MPRTLAHYKVQAEGDINEGYATLCRDCVAKDRSAALFTSQKIEDSTDEMDACDECGYHIDQDG